MNAALLDKHRIADSFSRAALSYDGVAELQRQVGHRLLERLPEAIPRTLLDLGSGTGYFTPLLRQRYPDSTLVNLDLAEGMLRYARQHRPDFDAGWICGDAEQLPLASGAVDLVFSSLAIQWCESPERLFTELDRVLRPGGRCVIATLGPKTLHELRSAWAAVDGYTHVNRFVALQDLEAVMPARLDVRAFEVDHHIQRFPDLRRLVDSLKGIGAHNMNQGQPTGLTGRARLQAFRQAYETYRDDRGQLPATYEVYYLELEKC